jgi:spore coat protein U-like protein
MVNTTRWPVPLAAALFAAHPLSAGTVSGTMTVGATVAESCRVDTQPMDFGTLPETPGQREARASVTLSCTPAASYLVTMDDGRNGSAGTRRMADASGTQFLAYELFSDAGRTRRWGASDAGGVGAIAPADGQVELAVYARLVAGRAEPGEYRDTVTVTVAF